MVPAPRPADGVVLPPSFYDRDTRLVARDLLGAILECETPEGTAAGRIVETEAYLGPHDPAAHSAAGLTERTKHLHGPPGMAYVYFIYGMYWCVNAVTEPEGHGSAVLIRALEPVRGIDLMRRRRPRARRDEELTNGPGKLCLALGIEGRHNGLMLDRPPLRILSAPPVPDEAVETSKRIGITVATEWELRWFVAQNAYVSKAPRQWE
jgi:DNA-3-methyladenine glycosylase